MDNRTLGEIYISEVTPTEDDAIHYGVPGMHWGIRKDPRSGSGKPSSKTVVKSMSDQELQRVVNRMRLEQQYQDMTANPAVKTGKKQAIKYGNQALNTAITAFLTATIAAYIKSRFKVT